MQTINDISGVEKKVGHQNPVDNDSTEEYDDWEEHSYIFSWFSPEVTTNIWELRTSTIHFQSWKGKSNTVINEETYLIRQDSGQYGMQCREQ